MASFPEKANVVIIGLGGIVGSSVAHHLIATAQVHGGRNTAKQAELARRCSPPPTGRRCPAALPNP